MKFSVKSGDPARIETPCIIVGVFVRGRLSPSAEAIDVAGDGTIREVLRAGDLQGKLGQTLMLHRVPGVRAKRVLLVGCGKVQGFDRAAYRRAVRAAARALAASGAKRAVCTLPELQVAQSDRVERVRDAVVEIEHQLYRFVDCKGEERRSTASGPKGIALHAGPEAKRGDLLPGVRQGAAVAEGLRLARDLANLPGNYCTPTYLAEQAKELGKRSSGLRVEVLGEAKMEKLGMGALLSVSRGSREPAQLIVVEYRGGEKKAPPVVLVGKGLTFDAGGISLKPSPQMDEMKYDMCGGASVLGTLLACAEMELPINLVGIVPASENLPDGAANKPGDVVTSLSGQTIEILNTDAEGRLILCDALTYAERFDPSLVIDVATLTGACAVALGQHASGLFSADDGLAEALLAAGEASGDRTWRLPLWESYQKQLESNFADIANIGGRYGGAITAACFLSRFTAKYPWAHLDIAGVAWLQGKEKGATGRPVALLCQFLMDRCKGDA